MKKSFHVVLYFLILIGCSPSIMSIKEDESNKINPIGLFVIGSTQVYDNSDPTHKDFVIHTTSDYLPSFFKDKGYQMKPLNPILHTEDVFTKYPMSFYINEDKIAEVAKKEGCSSVLIIYFAYIGNTIKIGTKLNIYPSCSLYGWLVRSSNASILASSHTRLNSFDKYLNIAPPEVHALPSVREIYRSFLKYITFTMFNGIPKVTGQ